MNMDLIYAFLISMLPFIELRGAIPYAIYHGIDPVTAFIVAVIGNLLPVPFLLIYLSRLESFARKNGKLDSILDKIFERTRSKSFKRIEQFEEIGLLLFVSIPLPGTGAWTGVLIAYLFGLNKKISFVVITVGVVIAGIIMTFISGFFL